MCVICRLRQDYAPCILASTLDETIIFFSFLVLHPPPPFIPPDHGNERQCRTHLYYLETLQEHCLQLRSLTLLPTHGSYNHHNRLKGRKFPNDSLERCVCFFQTNCDQQFSPGDSHLFQLWNPTTQHADLHEHQNETMGQIYLLLWF